MGDRTRTYRPSRWLYKTMMVVFTITVSAAMAWADDGVDPEADRILREMSDYLAGLPAFSMKADIDNEIVDLEGQKLQLSAYSEIVVQRPDKFHIARRGLFADAEFIFDGKALTLFGKRFNIYMQIESPGGVDDAIRTFEGVTGLDAPGADLLFSDPYAILAEEVTSGAYLGVSYVEGAPCHHLAFRKARVDWQIWVKTGDQPLPMKYVITSKWVTGAPQYTVRPRDWNTNPEIPADAFRFTAPAEAKRIESLLINEMGEFFIAEKGE